MCWNRQNGAGPGHALHDSRRFKPGARAFIWQSGYLSIAFNEEVELSVRLG
jgi:hypothetical protein